MITSSSISYVSQMLEEPQNINDADAESIRQMTEAYPYFVPARYMEAALQHKVAPYTPEMMAAMQLFSGNWLLYSEYLENAMGGEEVVYEPAAVAEAPKKVHTQLVTEEELPGEEEEITIAQPEVHIVPVEELQEEDIINEAEIPVTTADDDFVPENTGFIRGKKTAAAPEQDIAQVEDDVPAEEAIDEIPEPAEHKPDHYERPPLPASRIDWDEKSENLIPPIYTEDYFRHQGMHVSNDIPADIGKKDAETIAQEEEKALMVVMSFSEWLMFYKKKKQQEQEEEQDQKELKTMWQKSKLAAALEEENDEIPENVFEMAVNSITKEENLASESLAEVMVKQGRYDRAIEMYKKLSLGKPQKKAYFARRIEEILKEK